MERPGTGPVVHARRVSRAVQVHVDGARDHRLRQPPVPHGLRHAASDALVVRGGVHDLRPQGPAEGAELLGLLPHGQQTQAPQVPGHAEAMVDDPAVRVPLQRKEWAGGHCLLTFAGPQVFEGGDGGGWDPKGCAPKLARQDCPNGKFRFSLDTHVRLEEGREGPGGVTTPPPMVYGHSNTSLGVTELGLPQTLPIDSLLLAPCSSWLATKCHASGACCALELHWHDP